MKYWYEIFNDSLRASNSKFIVSVFAGLCYFSCGERS